MKVFFVYNPYIKKWEQQNYLERENIIILVDNFILCPVHKEFEKIFHYGQLTADSPTITKTCTITTNCYALPEILINKKFDAYEKTSMLIYDEYLLNKVKRENKRFIYAYEIFERNQKLYIKTYFLTYKMDKKLIYTFSEETLNFYKEYYDTFKFSLRNKDIYKVESVHYLNRKRKEKVNIPYRGKNKHITKTSYYRPDISKFSFCDEIIDYIIMKEMINFPKEAKKYSFGSKLVHGIDRYKQWQQDTDINIHFIEDNLKLRIKYLFYNRTSFEIFSIIMNELRMKNTYNLYHIYKENPLDLLKVITLYKIGFSYADAVYIVDRTEKDYFLGEYISPISRLLSGGDTGYKFSYSEKYLMKFSHDNFFPDFLHWAIINGHKKLARSLCISKLRFDKNTYILWKILEITNNLPAIDEISVQKFINRAIIGFDAISHVFVLNFVLDKRYKDGKAGDYSYTELLTFQDILKVSKIIGTNISYLKFLSCILNKDRYVMIRKDDKVVGLLFASIGSFEVNKLEEIPLESLEGWKIANSYKIDTSKYIRIPEIFH